jgi:hypothetical protein
MYMHRSNLSRTCPAKASPLTSHHSHAYSHAALPQLNEGQIDVDQAALTGESLPVTLFKGDSAKMGSTVTRGEVEGTVEVRGGRCSQLACRWPIGCSCPDVACMSAVTSCCLAVTQ